MTSRSPVARARTKGACALIVTEPPSRVFSDDLFFPGLIKGIRAELGDAGRHLVLTLASGAESYARIRRYVAAGHIDGAMIASMHGADPLPAALRRAGIPVVVSGRPLRPAVTGRGLDGFPFIDIDHTGGAQAAVRHLVAQGRARIAAVAGPQDMVAGVDRLAGYRAALAEAGAGHRSTIAVGDFTRASGARAMRQLLADDRQLDAVFVASDLMADGALDTLRHAGRRVPDDIAVIGFDDFEIARHTEPALTTVRQPITTLGRRLARQLLRLTDGEEVEPEVLPTELIVRDSA